MPELVPPPAITSVTVFSNRARVTRSGKATLPQGASVVEIPDIPLTLQQDSVRVRGWGEAVKILGIDVATAYLPVSPDTEVQAVQAQVEALEAEIAKVNDAVAILQDRLKTLASVRANSADAVVKGIAKGRTSVEALDGILAYADREEAASRIALQSHSETSRDLNRQLAAVKAKLQQMRQAGATERRSIRLSVDTANPGETPFDFAVTYVCDGATWEPLYDMRLDDQGKVHATYLAMVTQNTGEDWSDVDLSLSTARAAAIQSIPKLDPWYLRMYTEMVRPGAMPYAAMARVRAFGGGGGDAEAMDEMVASAAPPQAAAPIAPAEVQQAEVSEQGASATFHVPRRMSIPSGGMPHRTQIAEFGLPAKVDYVAAPKLALEAYIRATVTNDSPLVLLPGKANLFHGDDFVGTSFIDAAAGREFELQMGVDERIGIERQLVTRDVSKTFLGGSRKITYIYRIKLVNRLTSPAELTLLDQIPHSSHEDIKVKLLDTTPKPFEVTELGELRWKITLESGAPQQVQFEFTIEHPKTQSVVGIA
ncbi:hypothetical protein F183_A15400 [Bryobacterales bacterium F-183]|nr:hypothetical protein F183_A15400 [Bryobacterales bacterium F-183]